MSETITEWAQKCLKIEAEIEALVNKQRLIEELEESIRKKTN